MSSDVIDQLSDHVIDKNFSQNHGALAQDSSHNDLARVGIEHCTENPNDLDTVGQENVTENPNYLATVCTEFVMDHHSDLATLGTEHVTDNHSDESGQVVTEYVTEEFNPVETCSRTLCETCIRTIGGRARQKRFSTGDVRDCLKCGKSLYRDVIVIAQDTLRALCADKTISAIRPPLCYRECFSNETTAKESLLRGIGPCGNRMNIQRDQNQSRRLVSNKVLIRGTKMNVSPRRNER